jgi:Protein of unknown function (DUF3108)
VSGEDDVFVRAILRQISLIPLVAGAICTVPAAASAQGKLEAHYTASLAGIPIGKGTWVIDIGDTQFKAAANGTTTGLVRFFTGGHGTSIAKGKLNDGHPKTTVYFSSITAGDKTDEVKLETNDGNVTEMSVKPPQEKENERVPITDEHKHGVLDPMTATLLRTPGGGNPIDAKACHRTVSIFDGRLRYDLKMAFKRMDHVKADKGYNGPVVVCTVFFVPVAGYIPTRSAIKYIAKLHDIELWLAPIAGTRVLVPYRIQGPTPIGRAMLMATQFDSVALPSRASINGVKSVKTQ